MATDREMVEVLGEFARTMVTDFPIQAILDRLVHRIVEILPVGAAGVTLISDGDAPRYVAASDPFALRFEQLQTELGEGPCLEAFRTGKAVAAPDLAVDTRFGAFREQAVAGGLAAVWTFPLRQGERRLGALDLYRQSPGELGSEAMEAAQTLADVTAAYLVNAQARADLEDSSAELQHRSLHDHLTGLPNRAVLLDRLTHALRSSGRSLGTVAVMYVDLDRFKDVNDDHGHGVGDQLLVDVARRLTALLRPGDTVARMSGDEFVVVCEGLDGLGRAETIAGRIVASLAGPFTLGPVEVVISASVGIALVEAGTVVQPEQVLHDADVALYQAKRKGGNRSQFIDRRSRQDEEDESALAVDLAGAARRGELRLHYQPIVRALDGHVLAVEALLRWAHPARGLVPPAVLVPLAEATGMIIDIGRWVLETACRDLVRWNSTAGGATLELGVNVSALQLMDPSFIPMVVSVLDRTTADPRRLVVEITEAVLLHDSEQAAAVLSELKGLGIRVALDDFGTGHSPLTYLRAFPVDIVKIDRSFVSNFLQEPSSYAIVTKVIELAHMLDLAVVSEGVETREQRVALAALGSEFCQGFHFARPMSTESLEALLPQLGGVPLALPIDPPPERPPIGRPVAARH